MTFEFSTYGFDVQADLADFARVTTLFEVWSPQRSWSRMVVRVQSAGRDRSRFRCRIEVSGQGTQITAEAIAADPFEVVRAAAQALRLSHAHATSARGASSRPGVA